MQKKLIALAIAGLSSAAFAQTNVTLYGVADVSLESVGASGEATGSGANYGNFGRVNSNSSYIGLKGTEDLEGGLKAIFQFETGFSADTGVYNGSGRDTFVGLSGGFGTVLAGNLTTPTRALGNRMEMLPGNTGVGDAVSLLGNPLNVANVGTTGVFDTRMANAIAYKSNDFNGFNFGAAYAFGENKTLDNAAVGAKLNTKAFDIGLNYANSGWDLGYAYGRLTSGSDDAATPLPDVVKNHRIGVGYTFDGGHQVTFQWNKQAIDFVGGGDLDANSYSLQGKYQVTPAGAIIADYTVAKDQTGSFGAPDTGAKLITVGYLHNLSKRTMVKAVYTRISNDSAAAYNFSSGAVGGAIAGVGGFDFGADPHALSIGVRHSF